MSKVNTFKSNVTGQEFSANIRACCFMKGTVYIATCNFCLKQYAGNTTQALRGRITGYRNNTDSALKARAIVHRGVFDNSLSFHIICQMSPDKILAKETIWVHRLRTAELLRLNRVDPCELRTGLP